MLFAGGVIGRIGNGERGGLIGADNHLEFTNEKTLVISLDGGQHWSYKVFSDYYHEWTAVAVSADGRVLAAAERDGGYVMISGDSAAAWSRKSGDHDYSGLAVAGDGTKISAAASGRPIQRSLPTSPARR